MKREKNHMKDLPLMSVEEFMHQPNKTTVKALKQSEAGKNLKKFQTLDEMFDDLAPSSLLKSKRKPQRKKSSRS